MRSTVIKNMMILATGSAGGQTVAFLSMPLMTRIYSPENMGVFSIYMAILELLLPFATLRYAAAIPLPQQQKTAELFFLVCLVIAIMNSLILLMVLRLGGEYLQAISAMPDLHRYWWVFPVGILMAGFYETLVSWSTRNKEFRIIAKSTLLQSFFAAVIKIILGLLAIKPLGLLLGKFGGQLSGVILILARSRQTLNHAIKTARWTRIRYLLVKYLDFPKFQILSRFLLILSQKIPLLFFASIYGVVATGNLGLAIMVVTIPILLVGQNTSQAFYAEIASLGKKNAFEIRALSRSLSIKLLLLSIGPVLVLVFFGGELFVVVFGGQWKEAGTYAGILAIYMSAQFVSSSLIHIVSVFDRQKLYLLLNASRVILTIASFGVAYFLNMDAAAALMVYSTLLAFQYAITAYFVIEIIPANEIKNIRRT